MKINLLKSLLITSSTLWTFFHPAESQAQTLFSDSFEIDSSAQWSIFGGGNGLTITNDYIVQFNFNYGTQTFANATGTTTVPSAPNSGGTTRGLKVTANKNRTTGTRTAAVSLYPKNMSFSNNFALRFDMFMDFNGTVPGGGSGSTEYATFGIDHPGNKVNWFCTRSDSGFTNADWPSDGVWFQIDGEGGTDGPGTNPGDMCAYVGDPAPGSAVALNGGVGGFLYDQNVDYVTAQPIWQVFPVPPGVSPGSPGKQWVQVEIDQIDGVVTWKINGYVLASHSGGATQGYTNGTIMLGYSDPRTGLPTPPTANYAIFDNVRVVNLGTSGAFPTVRITPIDSDAAEPSDPASFSIDRVDSSGNALSGDAITNSLTVNLQITGTASNGIDYVTIPSTVTLLPGVQSTNINITPINDGIGEPTESISIRIVGGTNYDIRTSFTNIINLADDGDITSANIQTIKSIAYENKRAAKVNLYLSGAPSTNVTVNYTLSGTATNGVDYVTIPGSQVIVAGTTNTVIYVTPINNSATASNKTVDFKLTSGGGYAVGNSSNATVVIRDDDFNPPASVLFSDNFDSTSTTNLWNINRTQTSDAVTFGYDYSADGIPPAPNSTNVTKGLKLEANLTAGAISGISLSPKNGNYTGDYRIRFDAWMNFPSPLEGGSNDSTEWLSAGVGTTGDHTILPASGDGIWFDTDVDGSSSIEVDFEAFRGTTSLLVGVNNVWVGNSQGGANPYYAEFGEDVAPQVQINGGQSGTTYRGCLGFAWHDMAITKQGTNITWTVDGLPFAIVPTNGATLSTNVFIGYYDPTANVNALPQFAFVLFDNFRVENLTVTQPKITGVQIVNPNVVINFTGGVGDTTNTFTVQSLGTVDGTYTNTPATITNPGSTNFQATTTISGATRFYRIKR